MSVYVDALIDYGWKHGPSCHMRADSLEELHEFANRLGLKKEWFQDKPGHPHYDLHAEGRAMALRLGAIELSRREWMRLARP